MVFVGYLECCLILGESDEVVSCKFVVVQLCGLVLVLCVGEIWVECEVGKMLEVVVRQLGSVIDELGVGVFVCVVVVYELVWVIGIGLIVFFV